MTDKLTYNGLPVTQAMRVERAFSQRADLRNRTEPHDPEWQQVSLEEVIRQRVLTLKEQYGARADRATFGHRWPRAI